MATFHHLTYPDYSFSYCHTLLIPGWVCPVLVQLRQYMQREGLEPAHWNIPSCRPRCSEQEEWETVDAFLSCWDSAHRPPP